MDDDDATPRLVDARHDVILVERQDGLGLITSIDAAIRSTTCNDPLSIPPRATNGMVVTLADHPRPAELPHVLTHRYCLSDPTVYSLSFHEDRRLRSAKGSRQLPLPVGGYREDDHRQDRLLANPISKLSWYCSGLSLAPPKAFGSSPDR